MRPNAKQEQRNNERIKINRLRETGKIQSRPIDVLNDFTGYIRANFPKSMSNPFYDMNKNKVINVDNAKVNLALFYDIMTKYNFEYRLVFGTLLGIYRDGDLIKHDQDIDIGIRPSQLTILEKSLPELCENGFNVTRYSKNLLVSLSRNDEYIDLYIFSDQPNNTYTCGMYKLWEQDFTSPTEIEFMDRKFNTVSEIEPFLVTYYGQSWKTPIKGISANPRNR